MQLYRAVKVVHDLVKQPSAFALSPPFFFLSTSRKHIYYQFLINSRILYMVIFVYCQFSNLIKFLCYIILIRFFTKLLTSKIFREMCKYF